MKVFITGVSGYIGGSVAAHLVSRGHTVMGLIRSAEQGAALRAMGVEPVTGTLTDAAAIADGVSRADAVVNTAEADDVEALRPLLAALAGTGKGLIHTGGSSIVVDDAQGRFASDTVFSDDTPFVPQPNRVPRVNVDRAVRSAGVHDGIRAAVISPTLIHGRGTGLKAESHQVPMLQAESRVQGAGVYIGEGASIWSMLHISDVVTLYALALQKAPAGAFFFAEAEQVSWRGVAEAISHGLGFAGRTASWPVEAAVASVGGVARVALSSNCRVRADNARRLLGWRPTGPSLAHALAKGL